MACLWKVWVGWAVLAVASSVRAQDPPVSGDAAVETQIRKGAAALLSRVQVTSTVRYRMHKGKESYPADFHGRVIERAPGHVKLRSREGREIEIPYEDIIRTEDS